MVRILHINDKIENHGGVETHISQLCNIDKAYGVNSMWLGIYKEKSTYQIKIYPDENTILFSGDFLGGLDHIKAFINRNEIDIIHIHSISDPNLICALFKLKPLVRSMHEPRMLCPGQGKFWRKTERICNIPFGLHCFFHAYKEGCCNRQPKSLIEAYKNVQFETSEGGNHYAAILVMSEYMLTEAIKVGYRENKLFLNPLFTSNMPDHELIESSHDELKSLIFVGRLSNTKGVHYFIQSGISLLKNGYNIKLDIVGAGHDEAYFKSLVPKAYKEQIIFHGWQSNESTDILIKKSYLMVFSSIYPEAFGLSGIEAMMRAKPVVAFNVGGVSTWLEHNKTGYLVKVKDVSSLKNYIEILIKDTEIYKLFSKNARASAEAHFSEKTHMSRLKEVYNEILNKREN